MLANELVLAPEKSRCPPLNDAAEGKPIPIELPPPKLPPYPVACGVRPLLPPANGDGCRWYPVGCWLSGLAPGLGGSAGAVSNGPGEAVRPNPVGCGARLCVFWAAEAWEKRKGLGLAVRAPG